MQPPEKSILGGSPKKTIGRHKKKGKPYIPLPSQKALPTKEDGGGDGGGLVYASERIRIARYFAVRGLSELIYKMEVSE